MDRSEAKAKGPQIFEPPKQPEIQHFYEQRVQRNLSQDSEPAIEQTIVGQRRSDRSFHQDGRTSPAFFRRRSRIEP